MARRVNDYTADLASVHTSRFGNFATLPLPDIDGALAEIEYALGTLKADGVILLANYLGKYLGDETFEPVWAELGRRKAVVFVHPGQPPLPTIPGVAGPLVDYPFDTTRAAVQLVLNGVLTRHPGSHIILAHAGGFVPYASHRFAELAKVFRNDADDSGDLLKSLRSFHFDTALSSGPAALPSLKAFAGTDRILFGSDFPYAPAQVGAVFSAALDADCSLSREAHEAINHDNAWRLFPRLVSLPARRAPAKLSPM
jgi:aminocarboxymuconate-semialdehyde decarboxylase